MPHDAVELLELLQRIVEIDVVGDVRRDPVPVLAGAFVLVMHFGGGETLKGGAVVPALLEAALSGLGTSEEAVGSGQAFLDEALDQNLRRKMMLLEALRLFFQRVCLRLLEQLAVQLLVHHGNPIVHALTTTFR